MELAYRLIVDESARSRAIGAGIIATITPVQELNCRDRMVDANRQSLDGWLAVRIERLRNREGVIGALFEVGAPGIHEDGTALVSHFPPGTDREGIVDAVRRSDAAARVTFAIAPPQDWSEWKASVRAHRVGALTITPPWLARPDDMQIVIEPAMAFGTGEHATTRGVVRLMQQIPQMPAVVADLGSGSAVLSICAAKLGAKKVIAIELDPEATGNAEINVAVNRVGDIVHLLQGDATTLLRLVAPVGLVMANIISSVLVEMLPVIRCSLEDGGNAILSGILTQERVSMMKVIDAHSFHVVAEDAEDGWWSVLLAQRL